MPKLEIAGIVVINSQQEVLYLKRSKEDNLYPGLWNIVAGTNENGESIEETARRELKEETGLEAKDEELIKIHEFDDFIVVGNKKIPIHITLFVYYGGDIHVSDIKLSNEHSEARFIPLKDLPLIAALRGNEFTPTDVFIMTNLESLLERVHVGQKVA